VRRPRNREVKERVELGGACRIGLGIEHVAHMLECRDVRGAGSLRGAGRDGRLERFAEVEHLGYVTLGVGEIAADRSAELRAVWRAHVGPTPRPPGDEAFQLELLNGLASEAPRDAEARRE
jgi:hypothetical protein